MARVPTIAEEDAKRPNRERECLVRERTRIVNRMKGTLARLRTPISGPISRSFQAAPRNRECRVEAGAGAAMNWPLYTKATAAAADYEAALERTFGAASGEARADCARNGSRPDHPLHPAFITKNEAASAWIVEKQSATAAAA